jgi:hypothetical protein
MDDKRAGRKGRSSLGAAAFGRRLKGDIGTFLVVPRSDRAYFAGSPIPVLGVPLAGTQSGLLVPAKVVRAPQPIDLMKTYVTYGEAMPTAPSPTYVADALRRVARDPFIIECARLLGAYESPTASREHLDQQLAEAWFQRQALANVRAHLQSGSTLVSTQALLLVIQWALLISPLEAPAGEPSVHLGALILAVQDGLGYEREPDTEPDPDRDHVFTGATHSALFREIVSNSDFNSSRDLGTTLAHHHERWTRLARELAGDSRAADLQACFLDATGITKDDFTAVGLALWAHCESHSRYPIPRSTFDSLTLRRETVDAALRLFTATHEELVAEIQKLKGEFLTQWSFDVLRRFPVLRMANGDLVVLSKRLLVERLFGWLPIFDVKEGLKAAHRKREADRADLWLRTLCEADAMESLRNVCSSSRLFASDAIQAAFGTDHPNADAAVEYADAWVVVEIGTHQLKRETTVAGDPEALENDLRLSIEEKAAQLNATILDLVADERALTGQPARHRRRYVAVLVLTEGFPVNPMTMLAIRERLKAAGYLQDPRIGELHILDQEELDMIEAIIETEGVTLLELLERHEQGTMHEIALKNWLLTDPGRHGRGVSSRPSRLEGARDAMWQIALDRLTAVTPDAKPEEGEEDSTTSTQVL